MTAVTATTAAAAAQPSQTNHRRKNERNAPSETDKKPTTISRILNYVTGKKKEPSPKSDSFTAGDEDEIEPEEHYKEGGYHPLKVGDSFKAAEGRVINKQDQIGRYIVIKKLGWGHFSTVWLSWDTKQDPSSPSPIVALKIIKSAPHYREAAEDEIELLEASLRSRGRPSPSASYIIDDNDSDDGDVVKDDNEDDDDGVVQENDFIVTLLDHFIHSGPHGEHVCMVFEVLGDNLLKYLRCPKNLNPPNFHSPNGVPLNVVRRMMEQILHGLRHLHHTSSIIHTDIKPENILLVLGEKELQDLATTSLREGISLIEKGAVKDFLMDVLTEREESLLLGTMDDISLRTPPSTPTKRSRTSSPIRKREDGDESVVRVKIADLGNSCWRDQHFTSDIQTRQYRAPEVILGLPYDISCDMWSLACMAFELATGDLLFDPRAHRGYGKCHDHLAQMIELLGRMPRGMAINGRQSRQYFTSNGQLKRIQHLNMWRLDAVLRDKYYMDTRVDNDVKEFCNLLLEMLKYSPKDRITAGDALKDMFFKKNK